MAPGGFWAPRGGGGAGVGSAVENRPGFAAKSTKRQVHLTCREDERKTAGCFAGCGLLMLFAQVSGGFGGLGRGVLHCWSLGVQQVSACRPPLRPGSPQAGSLPVDSPVSGPRRTL